MVELMEESKSSNSINLSNFMNIYFRDCEIAMDDQKIVTEEYSKPKWYSILMKEFLKSRYNIVAVVFITLFWLSFIIFSILKTTSHDREWVGIYRRLQWILPGYSFHFLMSLYSAITAAYYRGATGAVLTYDITKRHTFNNIEKWLDELHRHADINIVVMLIGNKTDLSSNREVPIEEAEEFAKEKGLFFLETSALDSNNVEPAFLNLLSQIYMTVCKKHITADGHGPNWERVSLGFGGTQLLVSPQEPECQKSKRKFNCCSVS